MYGTVWCGVFSLLDYAHRIIDSIDYGTERQGEELGVGA